jgi:hypothetical protein
VVSNHVECTEKMRLLQEVQKAMGVLMSIHNDEVAALLKEDFNELTRLRRKLAAARDDKASKVDAFRDHVIKHRC